MSQPRPSSRDEYQIAILCALPLEYNAVSAIFDCFWDEQGDNFGRVPGDPNCYTTGCIGRYNVVLALISRIGKAYAASAAASLRSSYGGLKLVLLVGVCGGMPYNQFGEEILLGDVVISKSVAQHDLGRKYPNSFVMKDAAGDGLRTSNKLVRNLIALFETDRGLELLETRTSRFLKELQAKTAGRRHRAKYAYPGAVEDKLFESTYRHRHRLSPACICKSCHGDSDPVCPDAISTPCSDLGCDDVHLVSRERLNAGTGRSLDAMYQPAVHLGCFASGDTVMKSATDRDAVSRKTGAIAFEMEGAGVWDEFDCTIIIKGVCDYADSHKSKSWQGFAAATAAAASKAVLDGYMQTDAPPKTSMNAFQSIISPDYRRNLMRVLPEQCRFAGREEDLNKLEDMVGFQPGKLSPRSVVALWGLSGIGKSQLVSEFVKRQWDKYNDRVIFWVSGESEEAFEQSVIGLLKDSQGTVSAGHDSSVVALQQRDTLVREFFSELSNNSPPGTLLVVDGLSGSASLQARLQKHLDGLAINCVILTTTSREVASYYPRQLQIQGLDEDDAVALLTSGISDEFRGPEADARELARLLKYHPLSLKVAASLISRHPQSISQYVEKWTNRALHDEGLSTQDALLHAFELSFEELQRRNPVSAYILMLFSFLDHRDMWYELCFNATDKSSPIWLQQISSQKRPRDFISPMHNLSFIEAKPHKSLGCVYEIHPAIHEFARWKAAQNETEYLTSAISLVAAQVPRSTHEDFVAITQRLEPHVSQCMLYIQQDRAGTQLDLVELEKFGNLFRHVGRYDEALQLYRVILGYLRTDEPSDFNNNMMANIENNIGLVHHARHEYSEAFDAYERASYMRQESLVEDRDALAITLYNQGRSLLVLNRLEEAQVKLQAAAGHFSNALHDEQRERHEREDVIRSYQRILNDLGETHLRTGQLEEAEQYIKMAFRGYLEAGHAMHPAAFAVRLNMGRVCVERYFFASARSIFEYIIATYSKWWGRRHPETMRAVNELAGSYFRHGKMKQDMGDGGDEELEYAAQCWTETLHFHEEMFGKEADVVNLTRSKLHELKELKSLITTNPYEMYYTSGQ